MNKLQEYCLVRFLKNSGKIDTALESEECEKLIKWAIKATTKTKETIIFIKSTGEIVVWFLGTKNGGEICDFGIGDNVESYCPGLVLAVNR